MEKAFKTYDELISILESRGIDFSAPKARGRAKRILQHEGYYNLINGYKAPFLQKDGKNRILVPDQYKPESTVNEIRSLYSFDRELRSIILSSILRIETNIKNLVSHTFSKAHGHKNYLVYSNFDTSQRDCAQNITKLIAEVQRQLSNRASDPSISHYLQTYGYVPLWVLNNILTLGTISKFYSLMKQPERQEISKCFHLQDNELSSVLTYLSSVRNVCAHSNRLYCFRTKRPLADLYVHEKLGIEKNASGEYIAGKRDLFAIMIVFYIILSKGEFNAVIRKIDKEISVLTGQLHVLSIQDVLSYMGFPSDWELMLKQLP